MFGMFPFMFNNSPMNNNNNNFNYGSIGPRSIFWTHFYENFLN